jgi:hypothetical protein
VKARRDDDFASEIEAHIALDAEPLVDGGLSPDQANAEASRRFGNVTAAREGSYDRQRLRRLDDLRDIRYTLRSLRRSRGFATVAFRIDDAPVPSRLVRLAADQQFPGRTCGIEQQGAPAPDTMGYEQRTRVRKRHPLMESRLDTALTRPTHCPSCQGRVIDTLAKVITTRTCWRCRGCDHTWTLATTAAARHPAR